ncbi:MAG: Tol-Pal system beta propeller repeat protein TolB [Desulfuromonadaceae bacterium]|nr:Tol-Pal system beta propeller repeat protein TolB [Desulfuromonadaceae bacterium]
MRNIICLLMWLVCLLFPAGGLLAADIVITTPGRSAIPIAQPTFIALGAADVQIERTIDQVFLHDLDLTGMFEYIQRNAFLDDASRLALTSTEVNFPQWKLLGADLLLKGTYALKDGQVELKFRLFDVNRRRLLTGHNYKGARDDVRRMVHRFVDQMLETLTGTRGAFDANIAFISDASGHKELYLTEIDGHNIRRLTDHKNLVLNPDFSPQGREVIFTSYRKNNPDLYRRSIFNATEARVSAREGLNIAGRYSPDGREIAVTLSKDGNAEIYLLGVDGKIHKRLTNAWGIDVDPSWSPLGDKIAFISNRHGNPHVFIIDILTGAVERLTRAGKYNATPAWSPDGKWILFTRLEQGGFDIYRIRPDGSEEEQLTAGAGNKEHPRWSPDGRFVIYSDDILGEKRLYIMRADGTGAREISPLQGSCSHPAWAVR